MKEKEKVCSIINSELLKTLIFLAILIIIHIVGFVFFLKWIFDTHGAVATIVVGSETFVMACVLIFASIVLQ